VEHLSGYFLVGELFHHLVGKLFHDLFRRDFRNQLSVEFKSWFKQSINWFPTTCFIAESRGHIVGFLIGSPQPVDEGF
jgi:hypothetical protein